MLFFLLLEGEGGPLAVDEVADLTPDPSPHGEGSENILFFLLHCGEGGPLAVDEVVSHKLRCHRYWLLLMLRSILSLLDR